MAHAARLCRRRRRGRCAGGNISAGRRTRVQRLRGRIFRRAGLGPQDRRRRQAGPGEFVVLPHDRTPKHLLWPGNTAQHLVASSERIRKELGYRELLPREEAIRRTIEWERANPPVSSRSRSSTTTQRMKRWRSSKPRHERLLKPGLHNTPAIPGNLLLPLRPSRPLR